MRRRLETLGYVTCFRLAALRVSGWPVDWLERAWTGIWYRYYCPYPIYSNCGWTARACVEAGNCGCSNLPRYAALPPQKEKV